MGLAISSKILTLCSSYCSLLRTIALYDFNVINTTLLKGNLLGLKWACLKKGVAHKRAWLTDIPPVCGGWRRPWKDMGTTN